MNWKVILAVGAVAGAVIWAARRRVQQSRDDGALWAEATDPVVRFGDA
jgi:hypothetical protein